MNERQDVFSTSSLSCPDCFVDDENGFELVKKIIEATAHTNDIENLNEEIKIYFKKQYAELEKYIGVNNKTIIKIFLNRIESIVSVMNDLIKKLSKLNNENDCLLIAKTLYKHLKYTFQLLESNPKVAKENKNSWTDFSQEKNNLCISIYDLTTVFMIIATRQLEFNKATAYFNEACLQFDKLDKGSAKDPNLQLNLGSLYVFYAEIKYKQGDVTSAKEALEKAKNILEKCKEMGVWVTNYMDACKIIADQDSLEGNYLQARYWYKLIVNYWTSKDTYPTVLEAKKFISDVEQKHIKQIAEFNNSKKSEIYTLSIQKDKIIITLDKKFYQKKKSKLDLEGKCSFDSVNRQVQIDIFSVSLEVLQANLESIENEFLEYSNEIAKIKKTKEEAKVELNKVNTIIETKETNNKVNTIIEAKETNKDSEVKQTKEETDESEKASRKTRDTEQRKKNADTKSSPNSKNKVKTIAKPVKKPELSIAEELGVPEEFKDKNLIHQWNNYIPKGTYIGFFDRKAVLKQALKLEIPVSTVDLHEQQVEKGEIGKGIKMNPKSDQRPFKTWIPVYGENSCRVSATVVGKFTARNGKMVTVLSYDTLLKHTDQDRMYKKK